MELKRIGTVDQRADGFSITLDKEYRKGLVNIEGFSLLKILWWADQIETAGYKDGVLIDKPYTKGPDKIGVFATRSQFRPNPVCITTIKVKDIDQAGGAIHTYYIDAFPGSPVLDIKPYLPAVDLSQDITVPEWCRHWPENIEASSRFDWESEFNFPS